ncbi:MAG: N-acetylmuramic acid 6-phosphate etherase [Oscillospiraceae bacterium]|nr:N-acetylmuramic acid 6-phosphate etherase [Oscillospiraceae bacterium]MDD6503014.1 N-acetylmuramic acid 6-phosphate etherase [Oscillospiraceae bacterium]MDY4105084.1 N-acetylmuramic acid 6-phosphate etherase [Oscillospiraceae bacterium]
MNWNTIQTEAINPATVHIDTLSTIDMVTLINAEDKKVADAVEAELPHIAQAVDIIAAQMKKGGRLVYSGCGTSGRLGVLDAVECPPTYSTEPEQVVGLIAGGEEAMFLAVEGAEDSAGLGAEDLKKIGFGPDDVLVGIAASGRTPYVLGAVQYAREVGAPTVSVSCCPGSEITKLTDVSIAPTPGPEVITGSTRMKSGTAQKMVLNMLSTCSMIKLGKVYGNLMVDVKATNEKLIHRCERIVSIAADVTEEEAISYLEKCDYRPKIAIVMIKCGVDAETAKKLLKEFDGRIADVVAGFEA